MVPFSSAGFCPSALSPLAETFNHVRSFTSAFLLVFVFPLFPFLGCVSPLEPLLRRGAAARSFQN